MPQAPFQSSVAAADLLWQAAGVGEEAAHSAAVAISSAPPPWPRGPCSPARLLARGVTQVPTLEEARGRGLPRLPPGAWEAIAQAALIVEGRDVTARAQLSRVCTTWRDGLRRACDTCQAARAALCMHFTNPIESISYVL